MVKNHSRAQALVEFALVVTLLFMIVFGLLEVSRLLFVYAAIITSSREAVRYGSVAGVNEAGDLYYQDCSGIRNTARRLAFFQDLQDDDIVIEYDEFVYDAGTGDYTPTVYDTCDDSDGSDDGVDTGVSLTYDPTDPDSRPNRIRVTVTGRFVPIVPLIPLSNMVFDSTSTRTIIGIIVFD